MFDIGLPEFLVLAIVAVFVFGPDKLPEVARQAARLLHSARRTIDAARAQVTDELGPEFADLDLRDLDPRSFVKKHLFDELESDEPGRPGHEPLRAGESAPYDVDAT